MSGFETIPHDEWADLRDLIDAGCAGKPWPVAAAGMDLRWLTGERRINRLRAEDFPTVRALAERWRWNRAAVDRFIRGATWQDPLRQCTLEWLRGDRVRPRVRQERDGGETGAGQERDGENAPTPEVSEETGQERDNSETEVRQECDSRASSPRASTGSPSTGTDGILDLAPASGAVPVQTGGLFDGLTRPAPTASDPAPEPAPDPEPAPIARATPDSAYHRAIEVFNEEHLSIIGTAYPWQFKGRDADGARVKSWLGTARVTVEDPDAGLMRLRGAVRAYLLAVEARTAWPIGEPAQTRHFTRDLPKWLQVDPAVAPQRPGNESKQSAALRALGKIDLSRFKKPPMEAP